MQSTLLNVKINSKLGKYLISLIAFLKFLLYKRLQGHHF